METSCKVCGGSHANGACTDNNFEADPLGSISKISQYMERLTRDDGGNMVAVSVRGPEGSYQLEKGERLVKIGYGADKEPFIRKDGVDTPFEEWVKNKKSSPESDDDGLEPDPLGSIPEFQRYSEKNMGPDGVPTSVHVAGDRSYRLGTGERLVKIGVGAEKKPFIRKDGVDTPFDEWKSKQQ